MEIYKMSDKFLSSSRVENIIYCIRNTNNSNMYFGSSTMGIRRLYEHIRRLKKNQHYNPYLQNAFNKYGIESFKIYINRKLNDLTELDLLKIEGDYIRKFGTYNLEKNPETGFSWRQKQPVGQFDLNGNLVKIWYCGVDSIPSYFPISLGLLAGCLWGRKKTGKGYLWQIIKNTISENIKFDDVLWTLKFDRPPIIQKDLSNNIINVWYGGIAHVAKTLNISKSALSYGLISETNYSQGFKWEYKKLNNNVE